ncbi:MAG: NeuD/PglB/VioB family sugar acetyltransferase [Phycisphaerales bacterium]|nr:NeuD/PglB/VioB family sugar acetyltransferase [Phycisphaerales bacterium]MCB9835850.1 NeuD/PglB/VioB family sugar acetyltransferase [Phycisphaera sp.]
MAAAFAANEFDTGILLIAGGGHALVVADAILAMGVKLGGFYDDNEDAPLAKGEPSSRWLGTIEALDAKHLVGKHLVGKPWIICLGDLDLRRRVIDRLYGAEEDARRVVHPSAAVSPSSVICSGVFVGPSAVVNPRARVLDHAIVNSGAIVEHDCLVAENAHIAPGAVLGGGSRVGNDTLVGLGARVLPGVSVGQGCTVGAGAVVTKDIPDGKTVVGCPARLLRS